VYTAGAGWHIDLPVGMLLTFFQCAPYTLGRINHQARTWIPANLCGRNRRSAWAKGTMGRSVPLEEIFVKLFAQRGAAGDETRVPLSPESAKKLAELGMDVQVESGMGDSCGWSDDLFQEVGAAIGTGNERSQADVVVGLEIPSPEDIRAMKAGSLYVGYLEPLDRPDVVDALVEARIDAIAMEFIPRTTLAQKMDALSSQANLAGYVSVLQGASALGQILPMMMTPAGTLKPARVFVIGVGVAGLQAIATAKRLGARVEAFDTRPDVAEQVRSLGAKFVEVDLGETGQTKDGYAKALTEEQRAKQQEAMANVVAQSDVVITTAQVFGRRAPVLVTDAMLSAMRAGSVVVDGAVDSGGNVEGVVPGESVVRHGVTIVGLPHLARQVPVHASQMYGANVFNLLQHFWKDEEKTLNLDTGDEIMDGCLIVRDGALRNEMIIQRREGN